MVVHVMSSQRALSLLTKSKRRKETAVVCTRFIREPLSRAKMTDIMPKITTTHQDTSTVKGQHIAVVLEDEASTKTCDHDHASEDLAKTMEVQNKMTNNQSENCSELLAWPLLIDTHRIGIKGGYRSPSTKVQLIFGKPSRHS